MKLTKFDFRTPSFFSVTFFPCKGLLSITGFYVHSIFHIWKDAFSKGTMNSIVLTCKPAVRVISPLVEERCSGINPFKTNWSLILEFFQESVNRWGNYFEENRFTFLIKVRCYAQTWYRQLSEITSHKQSPVLLTERAVTRHFLGRLTFHLVLYYNVIGQGLNTSNYLKTILFFFIRE